MLSGQVAEHEVVAYPLGARPTEVFATLAVPLQPGDRLVLCSDGIIEAADARQELFQRVQNLYRLRVLRHRRQHRGLSNERSDRLGSRRDRKLPGCPHRCEPDDANRSPGHAGDRRKDRTH